MEKKINHYLNLPYTVETIKNDDGSYFIKIKELPGCISEGNTLSEAYEMIQDAQKVWILDALESNESIPLPESMVEKQYSGKFVVRTTTSLHKILAESAKRNDVSLNHYVNELLSGGSAREKVLQDAILKICLYNSYLEARSRVWDRIPAEEYYRKAYSCKPEPKFIGSN